jgi:putative redox protein
MAFTATAIRTGDGLRYEVDVNGRHTLVTDEPHELGGTDEGPAPHELLPAALAACIGTMVSMYAQSRGWDIGEPRVDVVYDKDAEPRQFDVELHLPAALAPDRVRRLERVAATCPLRRALEAGCAFDERTVLREEAALTQPA